MTPQKKISQTLLEYLEPFLHGFGEDISREELEKLLEMGTTVWNACVVDAWHGSDTYVAEVRKQFANMPHPELTEYLIERKRAAFADDLRGITNPEVLERNGEVVIRAEARAGPAGEGNPSNTAS
jgi:hypothetical protein